MVMAVLMITTSTQSTAVFTPCGCGNWGRPVERTKTSLAPGRPRFLPALCGDICREVLNLFRPLGAGSPSLSSLVHDANQPTRGIFHRFQFSPVLSVQLVHKGQYRRRIGQSAVKE